MRNDAIKLEEERLREFEDLSDYDQMHERHRIFPIVFGNRKHERIIDLAAGMGVVAKNIQKDYNADLLCNDISPKALTNLENMGLNTVSFDLDDPESPFPFPESRFDAVVNLATIEHVIHIDHYMQEIKRILTDEGFLYISAPNYSGLTYLLPFLLSGRSFHDPLNEKDKYEFYAHVRYFTYRTLLEYVSSFGFTPVEVYLPVPKSSSRYQRLYKKNRLLALFFKHSMQFVYSVFSPRWAAEPVICFKKGSADKKFKKAVL